MKIAVKIFVLLFFLNITFPAFSQDNPYSGYVHEEDTRNPVAGAVVSIFSKTDTVYTATNEKGAFFFESCPPFPFEVQVSHLSYKTENRYKQYNAATVDYFLLKRATNRIKESSVSAKAPVFTIKGDTLTYHVAATQEVADNDMMIDILTKLPGVETSGGLKIMGQEIARAYINDKLIFGDNTSDAMKHLAGRQIISIKVYDEAARNQRHIPKKFRKEKERVINVKTRDKIKDVFTAHVIASYGRNVKPVGDATDNRYSGGVSVNFFNETHQVKASGFADNTGRSNDVRNFFSTKSTSPNYRRNIDGSIEGVFNNYNKVLNKVEYGYSYRNMLEKYSNSSVTEYIDIKSPATADEELLKRISSGNSTTRTGEHAANLCLTTNYGDCRLNFRMNDNSFSRNSSNLSQTVTGSEFSVNQNFDKDTRNYDFNGFLTGDYGFENGFGLHGDIDFHFIKSDGNEIQTDTTNATYTTYKSDPIGKSFDFKGNIGMTKHYESGHNFKINYKVNTVRSKTVEYRYLTVADEARLDNLTSNLFTYNYLSNSIGASYNFSSKINVSADVIFSRQLQDRTMPEDLDISKKYVSLQFFASYYINRMSKGRNTVLMFTSSQRLPSVEQSSPYFNTKTPLSVQRGNPEIRPSREYNLSMNGTYMVKKRHSFTVSASVTAVTDNIAIDRRFYAEDSVADGLPVKAGTTYSTYSNISGTWDAKAMLGYQVFIPGAKISLKPELSYNYSRVPELVEGVKIISNINRPVLKIGISTAFSKNFKLGLSTVSAYTSNMSREHEPIDFFDQSITVNSENRFLKRAFVNLMYQFTARVPIRGGVRLNSNILNAVGGVYLLKNKELSLSLSCNDILNDTKSMKIVTSQNYVRTTFSPFLGRYWSVSLIYRFNSTVR